MKKGFYLKLAWTGIRKNKKLYLPYLLTCIGMVMMFYIVSFLSTSQVLREMKGGDTMQSMLMLGYQVIGVFALIFLFYTNSFLIRRRKTEFGLYNILGMGKRNLARVLLWESLIITVISLAAGLLSGMILSKFAELGMVNICGHFYLDPFEYLAANPSDQSHSTAAQRKRRGKAAQGQLVFRFGRGIPVRMRLLSGGDH